MHAIAIVTRHGLTAVALLAYLDKADAELAARVHPMFDPVIPVFNSDTFPGLTAAQRDRIAIVIDDLRPPPGIPRRLGASGTAHL